MADEIVATEAKKKTQRRLYTNVYVIVNRQDPKDNELCFDQNELMTKLMDPEWTSKYFPIVIDTDKLYHV